MRGSKSRDGLVLACEEVLRPDEIAAVHALMRIRLVAGIRAGDDIRPPG